MTFRMTFRMTFKMIFEMTFKMTFRKTFSLRLYDFMTSYHVPLILSSSGPGPGPRSGPEGPKSQN